MSRRFLKSAQYSVHKLLERCEELSFQTRYDYKKGLKLAMEQLHEMGSQISNIRDLKPKHVEKLVNRWKTEGLQAATIKNRVSQFRFISKKIHKSNLVPMTNAELAIPSRITDKERNRALTNLELERFTDPYVKHSVRLQQLFGLRREESMKFIPSFADRGHYIVLKASWTKGGIERIVALTDPAQRTYLDQLKREISRGKSLIPNEKNYRQQLDVYVSEVRKAGYKNLHGLRHAYAQSRYKQITDEKTQGQGWSAPKQGGPKSQELSPEQQEVDFYARRLISNELGHSRVSITQLYLG